MPITKDRLPGEGATEVDQEIKAVAVQQRRPGSILGTLGGGMGDAQDCLLTFTCKPWHVCIHSHHK